MKQIFYLFLCCIINTDCHKSELKSEYTDTPQGNFEALWNFFDKNYCSFEVKNIDWKDCYTQYSGQINPNTTDYTLYDIFSQMLLKLKDGHINLYAGPGRLIYYDFATGKPGNYLGVNTATSGITSLLRDNSNAYGIFPENIGYINIADWAQQTSIDKILSYLKDAKALIIDLRNNGGGSDKYSGHFISRFTDKEFTGSYYRWKNGPGHNEFGQFQPRVIKPDGPYQYLKPIIVLINRRSFSTTEGLLLDMKQLPNIRTLGDTTGGGAGVPLLYYLPNGWSMRVPRALVYDINKETYEGKGIAPDIVTYISSADSIAGYDRIVKRAIEILR